MNNVLEQIKGKLIVSCQALEHEALHGSHIMRKMAKAAQLGGAVAIRSNSVSDIVAIKEETGLPVIGLIKRDYPNSEVYITPTVKEIEELLTSKCEIIAMDATTRVHPDGISLKEKVDLIHSHGVLVMADVSTYAEGVEAQNSGFDMVSTTLSGYTPYSPKQEGPDVELVSRLVKDLAIPVIAEGRISCVEDVLKLKEANPYSMVIGGAITRPDQITKKYVAAYTQE